MEWQHNFRTKFQKLNQFQNLKFQLLDSHNFFSYQTFERKFIFKNFQSDECLSILCFGEKGQVSCIQIVILEKCVCFTSAFRDFHFFTYLRAGVLNLFYYICYKNFISITQSGTFILGSNQFLLHSLLIQNILLTSKVGVYISTRK